MTKCHTISVTKYSENAAVTKYSENAVVNVLSGRVMQAYDITLTKPQTTVDPELKQATLP